MFMPATLILHHWNLNAFPPGIQGHILVVLFDIVMNYTDQISDMHRSSKRLSSQAQVH